MDPRLRTVVIILVGAAVGAVVAGGAISYVNSSAPPMMPASGVAQSSGSSVPSDSGPAGGDSVANAVPSSESASVNESAPATNEDTTTVRSSVRGHLFDSNGPSATVTSGEDGANPPPEKPAAKKAPPVVEEDASPKVSDDGGGVRDSGGKDGDGGSVR